MRDMQYKHVVVSGTILLTINQIDILELKT